MNVLDGKYSPLFQDEDHVPSSSLGIINNQTCKYLICIFNSLFICAICSRVWRGKLFWKWIRRQWWVGQWRIFRSRSWLSGLWVESASILYTHLNPVFFFFTHFQMLMPVYCYLIEYNCIRLSSDGKIFYVFFLSPASFTTVVAVGMVTNALTCTSASMQWKESVAMGLNVSWTTPEAGGRPLVQTTDLRTDERMRLKVELNLKLKNFYTWNSLLYFVCT